MSKKDVLFTKGVDEFLTSSNLPLSYSKRHGVTFLSQYDVCDRNTLC